MTLAATLELRSALGMRWETAINMGVGSIAMLSCGGSTAVMKPPAASPAPTGFEHEGIRLPPLPPDECSSSPTYVAPADADHEVTVSFTATLKDLVLKRVSMCLDGALFWSMAGPDAKVTKVIRVTGGPHTLNFFAAALGTGTLKAYLYGIHSPHAVVGGSVTGVSAEIGMDPTGASMQDRPTVRWRDEPGVLDAGSSD